MQKTHYDAENNVLHLVNDKEKVEQVEKRALRGFIVTLVNNEADLKLLQSGDASKMQLSPVMAKDEEEAVKLVASQGKLPLNVVNYEFLEFQIALIKGLSEQENIELVSLDLYRANPTS